MHPASGCETMKMKVCQRLPAVACVVACIHVLTAEAAALCGEIYNPTPDGKLEYVRKNDNEWNNYEIVTENGERMLFCEVENFCNLQWYAYDNATEEIVVNEDEHIELKDHNQSLVITARMSDQRYYTCKASNGAEELEPRTIFLQVLDESAGIVNILIHHGCKNKTTDIGDTSTFFCKYSVSEQFIFMTPYWSKLNETDNADQMDDFVPIDFINDENEENPEVTTRYEEIRYYGPDDCEPQHEYLICNTSLYIYDISEEAFSTYRIRINIGTDGATNYYDVSLSQKISPPTVVQGLTALITVCGVFLILTCMLAALYYKKTLEINLWLKDNCKRTDWSVGDAESDAYISYSHVSDESEDDLNFVVSILKMQLERRGYCVVIRDRDHTPGTSIHEEIVNSLDKSRRCILVISPAYVGSWIGNYDINVMMDRMKDYKHQLIPIIFRDVSHLVPETDGQRLLKHVMENVRCITWPDQGSEISSSEAVTVTSRHKNVAERTFFKKLMYRMPPLRFVSRTSKYTVNTNSSLTELTTESFT